MTSMLVNINRDGYLIAEIYDDKSIKVFHNNIKSFDALENSMETTIRMYLTTFDHEFNPFSINVHRQSDYITIKGNVGSFTNGEMTSVVQKNIADAFGLVKQLGDNNNTNSWEFTASIADEFKEKYVDLMHNLNIIKRTDDTRAKLKKHQYKLSDKIAVKLREDDFELKIYEKELAKLEEKSSRYIAELNKCQDAITELLTSRNIIINEHTSNGAKEASKRMTHRRDIIKNYKEKNMRL